MSASKKYLVHTHDGQDYEVTAASIEVDGSNPNVVTFYNGNGDVVAQENNCASARPKNG